MGTDGDRSVHAFLNVQGETDAQRFADGLCFEHHRPGDAAGTRLARHHIQRGARQRRKRVERQVSPELHPDLVAQSWPDGSLQARSHEQGRQGDDPFAALAGRFAEDHLVVRKVLYDPGFDDLGGWVDDASNRPLGPDVPPDDAVRIDALDVAFAERRVEAVEVPPGDAVDGADHGGVPAQQGSDSGYRGANGVRLQRHDHRVLLAERPGIVRGRDVGDKLFAVEYQRQAVIPDRLEVRAARHHGDVCPRTSQQHGQVAADRAGTVDADLQLSRLPERGKGLPLEPGVDAVSSPSLVGLDAPASPSALARPMR